MSQTTVIPFEQVTEGLFGGLEPKYYDSYVDELPDAQDKVVAVTGTTQGIGFWVANACVRKNVQVLFLLNRPSERVENCVKQLSLEKEKYQSTTEIVPVECDLNSFGSIKSCVVFLNNYIQEQDLDGLHVLMNNAGIAPMYSSFEQTKDGFHPCMQTCYTGHFYLMHLLFPLLNATAQHSEVRIVQQSSFMRNFGTGFIREHYFKRNSAVGNSAELYHQAKLANICLGLKLAEKFHKYKISPNLKSVVAEPGLSETTILSKQDGIIASLFSLGVQLGNKIGVMKAQGCPDGTLPMLHCAFGADVENGDFFKPENFTVGRPLKKISKGKGVFLGFEWPALSQRNQELVWRVSEEAIGDKFFGASGKL
eukprot:maker-scaffold_6-snap-gene-0.52-mRNA-1 protein AED:0.00 eAED:0.00 QI:57/1/1/1/0/0/2/50/365